MSKLQENTYKAFNKFGKALVKQSRTNLTKGKHNATKNLYNAISYDLKVSKNSFQFTFDTSDNGKVKYGEYLDKGVKGVGGTKADGSKWKLKKVDNNNFKYKNKKPPAKAFDKWAVKKGIAPRNDKGQFTSRKGLQFALSNAVYHQGIESTHFYSRPFEYLYKRLPEEVIKAFDLDLDTLLKNSLK